MIPYKILYLMIRTFKSQFIMSYEPANLRNNINRLMEPLFSILITLSLMTEARDAIGSSYSSASGAAASTRAVYGSRTAAATAAATAEDHIVATCTIIRTAYSSAIAACKAALVSLMTSLKSGPNYQRLNLRMSSFLLKILEKNSDETYTVIISCIDKTYFCHIKVDSNIEKLNHMTAQENLGNEIEIKNLLLKMKKDMKEACEAMVMLFIEHAKVCTEKVITLHPETTIHGDRFVCFIICFEENIPDPDLCDLLKKYGTIHYLIKKADLSDETHLFEGTNVFEVHMILSSDVTRLFQNLVDKIPSVVPVLYSTE